MAFPSGTRLRHEPPLAIGDSHCIDGGGGALPYVTGCLPGNQPQLWIFSQTTPTQYQIRCADAVADKRVMDGGANDHILYLNDDYIPGNDFQQWSLDFSPGNPKVTRIRCVKNGLVLVPGGAAFQNHLRLLAPTGSNVELWALD